MKTLGLIMLFAIAIVIAAQAEVVPSSAAPDDTPTSVPAFSETPSPAATPSPSAAVTPSPVETPAATEIPSPLVTPASVVPSSPAAPTNAAETATPIASPSPSPAASPTTAPTLLDHHWIVDERQSAMDDSSTVTFSLLGVRDSASDQPTNDLLVVRWREGKWDVMVSTNHEFLGDRYPTVMTRWDRTPAETALWLSSSDFTAAFCPIPTAFIERASKASKLVVRLFPKFAGESTVVFDLTGLSDDIEKYPKAKASLNPPAPAKKTK